MTLGDFRGVLPFVERDLEGVEPLRERVEHVDCVRLRD